MQYNTQHIEKAVKFLNNANVNFEYDAEEMQAWFTINVEDRIWTDGSSIWNKNVVKGVKVENISLMAQHSKMHYNEADWDKLDKDDLYWSGGLTGYIHYDGSGKDGTWYDGADVEGNTLLNPLKDEADSDGMIYTDDGFIKNAEQYMIEKCDFDEALLGYLSFDYSEQGAQDDGMVNLDVEMDGDFWVAVQQQMQQKAA